MKRIYFNATILNDKPTGLGIYTINVLKRLDKFNIINTVIFNNKEEEKRYSSIIKNSNTTNIKNNYKKLNPFFRNYLLNMFIKQQLREGDTLYSPTQHGVNIKNINQIITIHDLIPIFYPNGRTHQSIYYKFLLPRIVDKCNEIITISDNTKKDILNNYKVNKDKIQVIYNGFNKPTYIDKDESVKYVNDKYKIKDFILMVGINYEYKNLHSVIKAYTNIQNKVENKLVIVGNYNNSYGRKLLKLVKKLGLEDKILFLGYVDDNDLLRIYQAAKVFVYPSLYEGFGMPILEAAANDTFVIASNYSSTKEIGKGIANLIDTKNQLEISNSILNNLNQNYNEDIRTKVNMHLQKFDWDKTSGEIYELLYKYL